MTINPHYTKPVNYIKDFFISYEINLKNLTTIFNQFEMKGA